MKKQKNIIVTDESENEEVEKELQNNLDLVLLKDNDEDDEDDIIIDDEIDSEFILDADEIMPDEHDTSNIDRKSKLIGKHSLKYDSIFRGKKSELTEEELYEGEYYTNAAEFDPSESFMEQTIDSEDSARIKLLKHKVLEAVQQIGINTKNHRRKPSKSDFNRNYQKVINILRPDGFTPVEIFVEYADYFSDNLYNMFTMLDAEIGAALIKELKEKKNLSFLNDVDFQ